MSNANTKENTKTNTKVATIVKPKEKVMTPKMYKVLLHNNDSTSFEAVMAILTQVFKKGHQDAQRIMMQAHNHDVATVLHSTKDICDGKILEVRAFVQAHSGDMLFGNRPHYYDELVFTSEEED